MLTSTKLSEAGHGASPSLLSPSVRSWVLKGRSDMMVDGDDTIVLVALVSFSLSQCIHVSFVLFVCLFIYLFNLLFSLLIPPDMVKRLLV